MSVKLKPTCHVAYITAGMILSLFLLENLSAMQLLTLTPQQRHAYRQIRSSRDPRQVAGQLRNLLESADSQQLDSLTADDNLSIAFAAYWEANKVVESHDIHRSARKRLSTAHTQRFIGFVEGALRMDVPSWWERAVGEGRAASDASVAFGPLEFPGAPIEEPIEVDGESIQVRPGTSIRISGATTWLRVNDTQAVIPTTVFREALGSFAGHLGIVFDAERIYISSHGRGHFPFKLTCISRTGSRLWTTEVWGMGGITVQGWVEHALQIIPGDAAVYVIGAHTLGVYLESFRVSDGGPRFRFSTNYWTHWNGLPARPESPIGDGSPG